MLYLNSQEQHFPFDLQRLLLAVDGYLFLGLPEAAFAEINAVEDSLQNSADVLRARIRVLLHLRRWREANRLSAFGNDAYPDENEFMVQRAFALHQMKKGGEAVQVLLTAPEWLRRTGILHYNLACYEAQLGDVNTARQCIRAAIQINSSFKKNARRDPDLQRLWN
jgi:tetratricopeptide (TPR) repeat protein